MTLQACAEDCIPGNHTTGKGLKRERREGKGSRGTTAASHVTVDQYYVCSPPFYPRQLRLRLELAPGPPVCQGEGLAGQGGLRAQLPRAWLCPLQLRHGCVVPFATSVFLRCLAQAPRNRRFPCSGQCEDCKPGDPNCQYTKAFCNASCHQSNLVGVYRGIEISTGFARREWDFTFFQDGIVRLVWGEPQGWQGEKRCVLAPVGLYFSSSLVRSLSPPPPLPFFFSLPLFVVALRS